MTQNQTLPYWDLACRLDVARESPSEIFGEKIGPIYKMGQLEPGIKFFILALEELGAVTKYSCEGHPLNAYVSFDATERLAKQIHMTSTFHVKAFSNAVTVGSVIECAMYALNPDSDRMSYTEETRVQFLRESAQRWMEFFGDRLTGLRQRLHDLAKELPHEQHLYTHIG